MPSMNIWNHWASRYERLWAQKVSLGPTRGAVLAAIDGEIKPGKEYQMLDMGCGTGQLIRDVYALLPGSRIFFTGVDQSQEMLDLAAGRDPRGLYIREYSEEYRESADRFDVIVCTHSFPYYQDQRKVLDNFNYMLKPGGLLLLAHVTPKNIYDQLVMLLVKLTTSPACYTTMVQMQLLLEGLFEVEKSVTVKEKFYMPEIRLFSCRKVVL